MNAILVVMNGFWYLVKCLHFGVLFECINHSKVDNKHVKHVKPDPDV